MPAPKKPRLSTGKASKPELKPLDPFLAELLNPALNRDRLPAIEPPPPEPPKRGRPRKDAAEAKAAATPSKPARKAGRQDGTQGFGEAPQAAFAHGDAADVEPALAQALGLREPDGEAVEERGSLAAEGVSATVDALTKLLTEGNPLFKNGELWRPHRPDRPQKSEGGVPFRLKSDFTRRATSPAPSPSSSPACRARSATRSSSASPARARPSRWPRSSRRPSARP